MNSERQELLKVLIEKFSSKAHHIYTGQCYPFGDIMLRKQQVMILFFIFENKGLASVKSIAKYLGVTSGAVTQFVDGLVENKLVEREENIKDRRIINIKLTPSTGKRFNAFKKDYISSASYAFMALSDEELVLFISLLNRIKTFKPCTN